MRSEKTVGGHRRFSLQAIAQIRREQGIARDTDRKRRPGKSLLSPTAFLNLILQGDEVEAAAALIDAYLDHHSLAKLFDTTVSEAMHELGELWFGGVVSIADEHKASRVVLNALSRLRDIIVPSEPTGLKAICCGIEGDIHELPVHLAEIILESEGWQVTNLGPNTPLFAVTDMLTEQRPALVCIAARSLVSVDRAVVEYAQLRKVAQRLDAAVVLGGEAFRDEILRARLPAELHATDFTAFLEFVRGKW